MNSCELRATGGMRPVEWRKVCGVVLALSKRLSRNLLGTTCFKEIDMAEQNLKGLRVAILVTDGFEQVELTDLRQALDDAGRRRYKPWTNCE
jgi:hypothetical protein